MKFMFARDLFLDRDEGEMFGEIMENEVKLFVLKKHATVRLKKRSMNKRWKRLLVEEEVSVNEAKNEEEVEEEDVGEGVGEEVKRMLMLDLRMRASLKGMGVVEVVEGIGEVWMWREDGKVMHWPWVTVERNGGGDVFVVRGKMEGVVNEEMMVKEGRLVGDGGVELLRKENRALQQIIQTQHENELTLLDAIQERDAKVRQLEQSSEDLQGRVAQMKKMIKVRITYHWQI